MVLAHRIALLSTLSSAPAGSELFAAIAEEVIRRENSPREFAEICAWADSDRVAGDPTSANISANYIQVGAHDGIGALVVLLPHLPPPLLPIALTTIADWARCQELLRSLCELSVPAATVAALR